MSVENAAGIGEVGRARASMRALETLTAIRGGARQYADDGERVALSGWSGWGPMTPVFAPKSESWAQMAERLGELLPADHVKAGRQGTYNAFFTPAAVARSMWDLLAGLGFAGDRVAELGCGSGAFMGTAPADVVVTGVERDPTSADIARLLNPDHVVIRGRLQDTPLPDSFGAVIGNVPFGDVRVFDPTAPAHGQVSRSLHTYFLWRAARCLAPGGYAVLLTSRYFLDAMDEGDRYGEGGARAEIGVLADFVGAVRLPQGALEGGTEAVADIVVMRRKVPGEQSLPVFDWRPVNRDRFGWSNPVSAYWSDRPGMVLGTMRKGDTAQYGLTVAVDPIVGESAADGVRRVTAGLVEDARPLPWVPAPVVDQVDTVGVVSAEGWMEGSFHLAGDGGVLVVKEGRALPLPKPGRELAELVKLRDVVEALVAAEADHDRADASIEPIRADVRAAYGRYVKRFGWLNRSKVFQKGVDAESGLPEMGRRLPAMGGFRHDPGSALVFALEVWDDETESAAPAALMSARQNRRVVRPDRAPDLATALAWCLDRRGAVDLEYVGQLTGRQAAAKCRSCGENAVDHGPGWQHLDGKQREHRVSDVDYDVAELEAWVARDLGAAVFRQPGDGTYVTREDYLSGDVRAKHRTAVAAAEDDGQYRRNVDALEGALPAWLGPADIVAQLSTPWIGPQYIAEFIVDLLQAPATVRRQAAGNKWEVADGMALSTAASETWGTPHIDAYKLIELALNGKTPQVRVVVDRETGRTEKDEDATLQAVEVQNRIKERFSVWVWEKPDRVDELTEYYNRVLNCQVARRYDGGHITVDGLAPDWAGKLYPHQREFIARALATPATLCGHPVGAGKTATMTCAAMKLRQVGLVDKGMLVVPNHLIGQADAAARIVSASAETIRANRRAFTARVATQPWDLVIITHSAFDVMPVHPDTERAYLELQKDELYESIVASAPDGKLKGRQVKASAKRLDNLEVRIEELRSRAYGSDGGVTFEQLGVGWVGIDEAHNYKNLAVPCSNEGFNINPSKRATALDMKLRWLAGRGSGRYAALFTGTPVSNTMLELYVMQQYLMPEYLSSIGLGSADAWTAAFVKMVTKVGVTINGGSFEIQTRPAEFVNAPELRVLFSMVADIRTADQLGLKRPASVEHVEKVQPTYAQEGYSGQLVRRASSLKNVRFPGKGCDNMLKVCNDGRWMATDPALVGLDDDDPGKLDRVAENMVRMWKEHPGELQAGFCDVGTPNDKKGSQTYGRLAQRLVDRGMPRNLIVFAHDAKSDDAKAAQFRRANDGPLAVILGSTGKLGTGTNIQKRIIAMHHIDAPYTPSGVEQRDGRGLRPGNRNAEVHIFRYVTARTFDAYLWQMLVRKLTFIQQLMEGTLDRTVEDCASEQLMSFSAIQASATDQPLLLERAEVDATVNRLRSLQAGHRQMQQRMRRDIPRGEQAIQERQASLAAWAAIGDAEVPEQLDEAQTFELAELMERYRYRPGGIRIGGLTVTFGSWEQAGGGALEPELRIAAGDGGYVADRIFGTYKPETVAARLVKLAAKADLMVGPLAAQVSKLREEVRQKRELLGQTFEQEADLNAALVRLAQIDAQLKREATRSEHDDDAVTVDAVEAGAVIDVDGARISDSGVEPAPADGPDAGEDEHDEDALMADVFGSLLSELDRDLEEQSASAFAALGL